MKKTICLLLLIPLIFSVHAQDSIRYRMIFIGDAGEMDDQQKAVIENAANHIIAGKTSVMYLGDNIYPRGIGLPGSAEEEATKKILQSQYQPMRSKGAPVYFIPGNHDWDKMGPKGLAKIKRQWEYLDEQQDSLLKMVPANGCPDPVAINVSDSLTIIAFDSEWWVYTYSKRNPGADCDCKTREEVTARLEELLYKNRYKVILLASHHPFQSYGTHGGYFSFKDHIFPLTAANKSLYIPLPVIGSLYPFLRSTFTNPEDLKHPLYKYMIKQVDGVFKDFPNMVHVAGHEHGLQFIKNQQTQIVSGAGAKRTFVRGKKDALFADAQQGYVTADLLEGNNMRFTYYIYTDTGMRNAFTYLQPYTSVKEMEDSARYALATTDSVDVQVRPVYDSVSSFHRTLFGENFRKEWAATTRLPVIRISELYGGLTPIQRGGGMQTKSLRLVDKNGKEWVIRSVEKNPDALLPEELQETFARDVLDDAMSSQHPFSALIMPPLADAVKVPHSNPVIGVIAYDKNLGHYAPDFVNKVCLLEEREPLGESDNTFKMLKNLGKDNDNNYASKEFLRARMLDLLVGDWDRHEDQWRWLDKDKSKKEKEYVAVPRDRDQALHVAQGWFPKLAKVRWISPTLQGFDSTISDVRYSLFKTRFINAYPGSQFSYDEWMKLANEFVASLNDKVLEAALKKLPASAYNLRHNELLATLKARRNNIPGAMDEYYRFINKIVDIRASDKNELVEITGTPDDGLRIVMHKISKDGEVKDKLMDKVYDASVTKEVRLYVSKGDDSIIINNKSSRIKLRIIGGDGKKHYTITAADKKIKLYEQKSNAVFSGDESRFRKYLSNDSSHTAFEAVNLYNVTMPLVTAGINADDGFLFGLGFRHTRQEGFRKTPYSSMQQVIAGHSFSTKAYRATYRGEWIDAFGNADFVMQAVVRAPNNTINFYGRGNESVFNKTGNFKRFYRTRFSIYQFDPAVRWRGNKGVSLSVGPSYQAYQFDKDDNDGRFINSTSQIGSYDSSTIDKTRMHAGIIVNFTSDKRNNPVFPAWGSYVNIRVQGYSGLNSYSKAFAQIIPEVALYKSLNTKSTIVLAERIGGGITVGKTAFYQSLFLGGQENLLGYRQFRFAGQYSLYNNLELRIKLADVGGYILPGQFGMMGFFDIGRVWEDNESSSTWHKGGGGGLYFAPARVAVIQFVLGGSKEGVYPYVTMGMRF
ncbi:BamA/TamA family outer membrane protein [Foetidibacter luteolus]|uniref:BamA/TamA family outer membrane protein n=1 Tax=Foetidibacter luteolus TaxID=2608880 RepID=UPI00129A6FFF|nr:BamA/TamA family outer membrane protein [Foetidibacter luteolus]